MVNDDVWVTVSELARQRNVDKAAISRRVKRFERDGLVNCKAGSGKTKLVNRAEFDRAAGVAGDAIRELAAKPKEPLPAPGGLARAQTDRVGYQAELARLDLEERMGKLVRIEDVEASMVRCAEVLVKVIEQLPSATDDPKVRAILKTSARNLREALAREMRLLQQEEAADEIRDDEPELL